MQKLHILRLLNLPRDTSKADIEAVIKEFAKPIEVKVAMKKKGVCDGYAFIEFESERDMLAARERLNSYVWKSRLLYTIPQFARKQL